MFLKKALLITALAGVLAAGVWVKVLWEARANFDKAEQFLRTKDHIKAIAYYDRALRWYAPLNPYPARAAERLWVVARRAEKEANISLALIALRTIRRGYYASRSLYTPGTEWIRRCDARISVLSAKVSGNENRTPEVVPAKDAMPDSFWALVVVAGCVGWIGSAFGFIGYALTRGTAGLEARKAMLWGTALIAFYTLWVIGMTRA
ncbi:MAG: hypothetical protein JRI36_01430 [Deltaproteobacteria bacterium]|nr:hypothetical protein [Deltaproteobacteria bacterium]